MWEVQTAQNGIVCPSCGRNNTRRALTCAGCRTSLRAAAASTDFNVRGVLDGGNVRQCASCGTSNAQHERFCTRCRRAFPSVREDENASETLNLLDVRQAVVNPITMDLTVPEKKRNIDKLQEAYDGLASGMITTEDYNLRVTAVYRFMQTAHQVAHGEIAKKRIEQLEPTLRDLSLQGVAQIEHYLVAISRMREQGKVRDLEGAEAGLRQAREVAETILAIKAEVDVLAAQEV